MTQRLFFALWPEGPVRLALHRLGGSLPPHHGRPTHPADLHATLVFLGPTHPDRLPCLLDAAGSVLGEPFSLTIDRVAYRRRSRILWCRPQRTPEPLQRLHSDVQSATGGCGFPPERRDYLPHITLARHARPADLTESVEPIEWRVADFVLVRSDPGGAPPHYTLIGRWPLGG